MKGTQRIAACFSLVALVSCATIVGADFDEAHPAATTAPARAGTTTPTPSSAGGDSSDLVSSGGTGELVEAGAGNGMSPDASGGVAADCPLGRGFRHLGELPPPANGSTLATTLASGLARIDRVAPLPSCQGALLSAQLFLTVDCPVDPRSTLVFGSALIDRSAGAPDSLLTYRVRAAVDVGEHFAVGAFTANPWTWGTLRLPLEARDPEPGELLTVITHQGDGLARAARVTLDASLFHQRRQSVQSPAIMSAVFNGDGRLLGFCEFDECATPGACISMASLLQTSPLLRSLYAMRNVLVADTTGDGRADLAAIDLTGVGLRRSDGHELQPVEFWIATPYFGSRQNLLADFDGDGLADLAVINDGEIAVRQSTGVSFDAQSYWLDSSFFGELGTRSGDVDGDGRADLAILESGRINVRRSTGSRFGDVERWAADIAIPKSLELADVDADARQDLVLVYTDRIDVALSTGSSFLGPQTWLSARSSGVSFHFADIDGDAAADAIRSDANTFEVFLAGKQQFQRLEGAFLERPPTGQRASYFADVSGDGLADAIALDNDDIRVSLGTGTDFSKAQVWSSNAYWGGL